MLCISDQWSYLERTRQILPAQLWRERCPGQKSQLMGVCGWNSHSVNPTEASLTPLIDSWDLQAAGWRCWCVVLRKAFAAPQDMGIQFTLPNSSTWVLNGCLFEWPHLFSAFSLAWPQSLGVWPEAGCPTPLEKALALALQQGTKILSSIVQLLVILSSQHPTKSSFHGGSSGQMFSA